MQILSGINCNRESVRFVRRLAFSLAWEKKISFLRHVESTWHYQLDFLHNCKRVCWWRRRRQWQRGKLFRDAQGQKQTSRRRRAIKICKKTGNVTASICLLSSGIFFPSNIRYKFTRFYKLPCSIKLERKCHYSKFYQIPRTSWNFNSIKITVIVFKSQRTFSEIMEFIKFLFKKISPTRCYFHFHTESSAKSSTRIANSYRSINRHKLPLN